VAHFLPADHSKGDANTIGGYAAVHARPAAFEGSDGMSYSVEICVDPTGEPARPYGGYLLFLRWRRMGAQGVEGHLETEFVAYGGTEEEARAGVGRMPLSEVRETLERLIRERRGETASTRRWWDVMREEDDG
jgi:hypothetical protein